MAREEKRGRGRTKRPRQDEGIARDSHLPSGSTFSSAPYVPRSVASYPELILKPSHRASSNSRPAGSTTMSPSPRTDLRTSAPPGKVAIPALRPMPGDDISGKGSKKGRTLHACDACRKAKAGCTGEQPCQRCKAGGTSCVYGDGKRDRDRKRMTKLNKDAHSLSQYTESITEALKRIRLDDNLSKEGIQAALDDVLAMSPPPLSQAEIEESNLPFGRMSIERPKHEPSKDDDNDGKDDDDASEVGSTGSLDVINVDTDHDETRATGHMGKASAVAWAKRTDEECQNIDDDSFYSGQPGEGYTLTSYYTEDADVQPFDTSRIIAFEWPEDHVADFLIQTYFDQVHDVFPVLNKTKFMKRYNEYDRGSTPVSDPDLLWLSCLNSMFAIGAVHAHFSKNNKLVSYADHLVYSTRARMLGMDQRVMYEDPRILSTVSLGLLCLYYMTTCRMNNAWTICGVAIRHALTLGLHVRSEATELSDVDKEHRVRLWWSLYSLECSLNTLTGRPTCISDRDISTPLPLNIDESEFQPGVPLYSRSPKHTPGSRRGSKSTGRPAATHQMPLLKSSTPPAFPALQPATTSTYFIHLTQLRIISHEIVTELYCAATIKEKWSEVQSTIERIDRRLLAWRDSLPPSFDVDFDNYSPPDWSDTSKSLRIGLALLYNSSRMILFRPCLCRFSGRFKTQSATAQSFNQSFVEKCIHSARRTISLLTHPSRTVSLLYSIPPFWDTLHYLCEALSVLMLEMAYRAQHLPRESADILSDAKKGIRWLSDMSEQSVSARKAWEIFDSLVRRVAPLIRWSVFDLPVRAPVPTGYNWGRFAGHQSLGPQQQEQHVASTPQIPNREKFPRLPSTQPQPQPQASLSPPPPPQPVSLWNPSATETGADPNNPFFNILHPSLSTYHDLSSSSSGSSGFGPFTPFHNPLDQDTALSVFAGMGGVHGHFDEPWRHMFEFTSGPSPSMGATETSGIRLSGMDTSSSLLPPLMGGNDMGAFAMDTSGSLMGDLGTSAQYGLGSMGNGGFGVAGAPAEGGSDAGQGGGIWGV